MRGDQGGKRWTYDVVDSTRAKLEQVDQREQPVAPCFELVARRELSVDERIDHERCQCFVREKTEMLSIHPLELFRIEDRCLLQQPFDGEELDHLRNRHYFNVVTGRPSEQ